MGRSLLVGQCYHVNYSVQ